MSQSKVSVDDRFARFGSKSFAINKVTSVDVRSRRKTGSRAYIFWWGIGAIIIFVAVVYGPLFNIVLAALPALPGWLSWRHRHPTYTYTLVLVTAGNEAQAFVTKDRDEVMKLRSKIEEAMSRSS